MKGYSICRQSRSVAQRLAARENFLMAGNLLRPTDPDPGPEWNDRPTAEVLTRPIAPVKELPPPRSPVRMIDLIADMPLLRDIGLPRSDPPMPDIHMHDYTDDGP
jgi:hypothetical protein